MAIEGTWKLPEGARGHNLKLLDTTGLIFI